MHTLMTLFSPVRKDVRDVTANTVVNEVCKVKGTLRDETR
jgi:hypothetical protein